MKKSFLLFGALLLTVSGAFAQAVIWTETFAGGIPAAWQNPTQNSGVDKTGTPHNYMWKWTNTGNHGSAASNTRLASPTAGDGWIIFDSDSLDNGGGAGFHPGTGVAPAPQRGYLTTPYISCIGHSNVVLQFYQLYLCFDGDPRVIISNASGITDTIDVNADYNWPGGETSNPSFKRYDISQVAGSALAANDSVQITFLWDMTSQGYYYWQVDDISLIATPANDMQIGASGQDGTFIYYSTPISEMTNPTSILDSLSYYAFTESIGANDQYDSRVAVTYKKSGSIVFQDTSAMGIVLPYGIDSLLQGTNFFVPPSLGTYTSYLSVFSDSVNAPPYMAADTNTFVVSDSVFAVDNGGYGGGFFLYLPADESSTGSAANNELADVFYLPNADTVTSITAVFDPTNTSVSRLGGPVVQANVYSLPDLYSNYQAGNFTSTPSPVIQTEVRQLTNADVPSNTLKAVTLKIDKNTAAAGSAVLQPGFYAVSLVSLNDSACSLVNGFSGSALLGITGGIITNGTLTEYNNTRFILRMNLGHNFNLLEASFTRTPNSASVNQYYGVTYRANCPNCDLSATYRWDIVDTTLGLPLPEQFGKTIIDTFLSPDVFYACLTVVDGGDSIQTCGYVNVVPHWNPNGINEVGVAAPQFGMVPNPTTGLVNITAENVNGPMAINVLNLLGEQVKSFSDVANGTFSKSYNLSDLSDGIYIVKIQNGDNYVTKRLSVTKQ